MRFKIRDILLVSSLYDSYIFEEDGRLYELLQQEYEGLNLTQAPDITHVATGQEAFQILKEHEFDLVITTLHIEDMHVIRFAKRLREEGYTVPVVALAYDNREKGELVLHRDSAVLDRVFIWQGDYRLLIGIIKSIEDKINVENDTQTVGVQCILLIEDNVKYYSSFLPIIYTEVLKQSERLISEGINLTHKFLRMRARPKILLCTTYEEAWSYYEKYKEFILGIISDVEFRRNGTTDSEAGLTFARNVRDQHPDIPILFQSNVADNADKANAIGASFVLKDSPTLLHELRKFMADYFSFGDFVFRMPNGEEVGRANQLMALEEQLALVPGDSILYHAERNHFSNWLKARTEFWLAFNLRPKKISDYANVEDLRTYLIQTLRSYREIRHRGTIVDFSRETFDPDGSFARIGGGSIGGKARGLGFIKALNNNYNVRDHFENVKIIIPAAVVVATDVFDQFMAENNLETFALECHDDEELIRRFVSTQKFPRKILRQLKEFLEIVRVPLAVRSSSLLEDSQYQPFAGVYETFMLPNNHPDPKKRLDELVRTIKRVYASTYYQSTKDYIKVTSYRLEEEKMAVIIQKMVGSPHENRFYPDFAGVAKSYNFYPMPPQTASDGIASVGLGLGKTVVEGGNTVRFCPKYPRHLLQFFSTADTLKTAQQEFYALALDAHEDEKAFHAHDTLIKKYGLNIAERDGTLSHVGSTFSLENDAVYDGIARKGLRVVTFAPILKNRVFPLPEILDLLLDLGSWGMGSPVEIEFAVNLSVPPGKPQEFGILQIRPMVLNREDDALNVDEEPAERLICKSSQVLGNGVISDLYDVVVVDFEKYDRGKSREVAQEISKFNEKLVAENRTYVLIGVGRWGTLDPWLGIPVRWDQISGARAIVESTFKDFEVTPSQGSHFFQNITSFMVGYFTVTSNANDGFIDWQWLLQQPPIEAMTFTRHIRFNSPIAAKLNGHQNKGIILKPENL
ncbi:histidine kinase [bacterium]|nr:histidine kinase [bacterium]